MGKHKKLMPSAKVKGKRLKPASKKRTKLSASKKSKKPSGAKKSVEDLLQQVSECVDNFEYQLALGLCEEAVQLAPGNAEALETMGAVLLELGEMDHAVQCLLKSVQASPDEGHSKYLSLGQLYEGAEAVQYLLKGIELMTKRYEFVCNQASGSGAAASAIVGGDVTAMDISTAYCSLAEVYLTDCCYDDDAEKLCEEYCTKAIEYCGSNPEAYQVMSSCLLSKQDHEKSRSVLLQGLSLWLPDDDDSGDQKTDVAVPSYQSRVSWCKLMLELEEYQRAHLVLRGLLDEDDEVVQVWFLLGWLTHIQDDLPTAKHCLLQAEKLYHSTGCDEEELLKRIQQLLEEIGDHKLEDNENDTDTSDNASATDSASDLMEQN